MEVKVGIRRGVLGKKDCCMTDCLKKKRNHKEFGELKKLLV